MSDISKSKIKVKSQVDIMVLVSLMQVVWLTTSEHYKNQTKPRLGLTETIVAKSERDMYI